MNSKGRKLFGLQIRKSFLISNEENIQMNTSTSLRGFLFLLMYAKMEILAGKCSYSFVCFPHLRSESFSVFVAQKAFYPYYSSKKGALSLLNQKKENAKFYTIFGRFFKMCIRDSIYAERLFCKRKIERLFLFFE